MESDSSFDIILRLYNAKLRAYADAVNCGNNVFLEGTCASFPGVFFSGIRDRIDVPAILFVLEDEQNAAYFYHDLCQISGESDIYFFPSSYKRSISYGQIDQANVLLRTTVLTRLAALEAKGKQSGQCVYVVSYPEALAEKVPAACRIGETSITLSVGQEINRDELQKQLFDLGFSFDSYVYEPGQYATRGSILDIFSYSCELPYRVDFFGDTIDSIRTFSIDDQLSRESVDSVTLVPHLSARENDMMLFTDYLPKGSLCALYDADLALDQIETIDRQLSDTGSVANRMRILQAQTEEGNTSEKVCVAGKDEFRKSLFSCKQIWFGTHLPLIAQETGEYSKIHFDIAPQPLFQKNFDLVQSELLRCLAKGYKIFILTDNTRQTDRLKAIFKERGAEIGFTPVDRTLHMGFADNANKVCCYTDHQIFDRYHKYSLKSDAARVGKAALSIKELSQFQIGDYIVHIDHGIGKFGGLVKIPVGDKMREVVKIIYKNNDVVFVSIHALGKISKYKGKDGTPPAINRLGSGAWENLKERTKGKIKDIARDLIQLYSKRMAESGFAFSPDSYLQNELEASFIYEDTPDQLTATRDIKADMESNRPMDRLVCGDVGFGKTELAIRAAFKAVADNKQVAVLVPTTVLAFQHFRTFSERLKDFPCRVEYLSRAKSNAQTNQILADLAQGKIDIIVGTHKLIGKGVVFKDLGLLIIDEEQKFGVAVKEKLKALKVNVDTLTLTATPIPRTLQFSLMGARDMSILHTPPANRYPIQTEIHAFSGDIIEQAVNFEMSRNGQLFIISNRISSLYELEALVNRLVPDARVAVGHGQMDPDQLEKIITGFINFDYDVLIATSIIENGIDIPNVNTIIINDAHNFGLSDLHQMRGRVGRSNRKAFCYLLAPPLSVLQPDARRRLQAIETFSDLGSGLQIALQDLDIRGAGNLLGAEQSGFIADLGYETYQKILREAMQELKTGEFKDLFKEQNRIQRANVSECNVESDLELFFPTDYVPNGTERISLYRELDSNRSMRDIDSFKDRLFDRFGHLPYQAEELIRVVRLKRLLLGLAVETVFLKAGRMRLIFSPDCPEFFESDSFTPILQYVMANPNRCRLEDKNGRQSMIVEGVPNVETALDIVNTLIQEPKF